ncbi:hypothetical protein DL546_004080 [Coniochaeta pulveracea]|uniref:Uncharacterized protein n=1 Tax=Coniochaeta pulveracea TaxID=177199 RepID=A0A420YCX3_9PEZI|nr:hypothetical protein DL546_004080 [Coniochaeta pulveracea]
MGSFTVPNLLTCSHWSLVISHAIAIPGRTRNRPASTCFSGPHLLQLTESCPKTIALPTAPFYQVDKLFEVSIILEQQPELPPRCRHWESLPDWTHKLES